MPIAASHRFEIARHLIERADVEGASVRVLLTGSSGWLDRFLAPAMRPAGHAVIGMDIAPGADTTIVGSVARKSDVERAFAEHSIEAVVHAGGSSR